MASRMIFFCLLDMTSRLSFFFFFFFFFSPIALSSAQQQPCSTLLTFNNSPVNLTKCILLPAQDASLAWTFFSDNLTLHIAFSGTAPSANGWIGWGINPTGTLMPGSSVLVAFQSSVNGSNVLPFYLSDQVQNSEQSLVCSPIDLIVNNTSVEITGTSMRMFAILQLGSNKTTLNHVWNRGSSVINFSPQPHVSFGDGLRGTQTIDMFTAQASGGGTIAYESLKRRHGILNTISWGFLLPLGAMAARYLRSFPSADPAWFYIHASCQCAGYILGLSGWALGMRLRSLTSFVHRSHQNIGIAIFVFGTLQVLALFLRPSKDHKLRRYWNVYHHSVGYTIILLSILNIFQGLNILEPGGNWRRGYIATLCILAAVSFVLEIVTWIRFLKLKTSWQDSSV